MVFYVETLMDALCMSHIGFFFNNIHYHTHVDSFFKNTIVGGE